VEKKGSPGKIVDIESKFTNENLVGREKKGHLMQGVGIERGKGYPRLSESRVPPACGDG